MKIIAEERFSDDEQNCCIYWVRRRKYHENFVDGNDCSMKFQFCMYCLFVVVVVVAVGVNVGKTCLIFVLVSHRC